MELKFEQEAMNFDQLAAEAEDTSLVSSLEEQHRAFTIYLIIMELLKSMNPLDILTIRATNSTFEWLATKFLLDNQLISINFEFNREHGSYISSNCQQNSIDQNILSFDGSTLNDFSEIFATSTNFPSTTFSFSSGYLGNPDIQNFLAKFGTEIEGLTLDLICDAPVKNYLLKHPSGSEPPYALLRLTDEPFVSMEMLERLLVEQIPFAKNIHLRKFPKHWKKPQRIKCPFRGLCNFSCCCDDFPSAFTLPHLKCFTYEEQNDAPGWVINMILEAAVNIQVINSDNCKSAHPNLTENNFHLLSSFYFYPSPLNMELYEKLLSDSSLTKRGLALLLKQLKIAFDYVVDFQNPAKLRAKILIENLFVKTSKQITQFGLGSPCGFLFGLSEDLILPKFPNVTELTFDSTEIESTVDQVTDKTTLMGRMKAAAMKKYFPPGIQPKNLFPRLRTVHFWIHDFHKDTIWEEYFDFYEPLKTVVNVKVLKRGSVPLNLMLYFDCVFPMWKYLQIKTW